MSIKKQWSKLTRLISVAGTVLIFTLAIGAPKIAQATHLDCGDVITDDTTLDNDISCGGNGLTIQGNKTLDLGGFTLSGDPFTGVGISVTGKGATIKNGTIDGFFQGVALFNAKKAKLTHLLFTGQVNGSNDSVIVSNSSDITIEHSVFIGHHTNVDGDLHPLAISVLGSTNVDVNNVDVQGYQDAVDFLIFKNTDGRIRNSTFTDNRQSVTIRNSINIEISNNHISGSLPGPGCCVGILLLGPNVSPGGNPNDNVLDEIDILNNHIHDGQLGIDVVDTMGATVSGNHVRDNSSHGVLFRTNSTNNTIKSNLTSGNGYVFGFDLTHDGTSTPNTWMNNSCETKDGADIPDC